jgi:pimeloyl-ACP methyl ester carboxylesterase
VKQIKRKSKEKVVNARKNQSLPQRPKAAIQTRRKDSPRINNLPSDGFFESFDGTSLWYEDTGGDGVPVFFVYGLGCSIQHWKYPRQHFAKGGRVPRRQIYLDLRGHGRSAVPDPSERFTMDQTVRDIAALCSHLGVDAADFLGQSMGGAIIIALARACPKLVRRVVLLGSPSRSPANGFPLSAFTAPLWRRILSANRSSPQTIGVLHRAGMSLLQKEPFKFVLRELVRYGGFNPTLAHTADIEEYISKITAVDGNTFFHMAAELEEFDVKNYQEMLKMPLLVIAGARDLVIPLSDQLRYKNYFPQAQIEIIPHGSHCPHFDDPSLVNGILERFLSE